MTEASCYLFHRMSAPDRQALLSDLFSSTGLGLSVARTCIGASDYSTKAYSLDDSAEPDPELKNFTIDRDRETILPTLREARKLIPTCFFFQSVEPAGMDEGWRLNARRIHAEKVLRTLCGILR